MLVMHVFSSSNTKVVQNQSPYQSVKYLFLLLKHPKQKKCPLKIKYKNVFNICFLQLNILHVKKINWNISSVAYFPTFFFLSIYFKKNSVATEVNVVILTRKFMTVWNACGTSGNCARASISGDVIKDLAWLV